jgi:oxepin-CoA hydrolase/3-oxo-5,6-dehydrosuberyl-CoA semialdehyde dehydrogenase
LEEFTELSIRTGATRRDTAVDVDGGIGTLAAYAGMAERELPAATVLPDGDTEPLARGGTFAGRHLLTPRLGAAVQINAYNFPVWGMLEKFAPAFLAGMPSVVKPAGQTAYLTELVVRRIVESGLLPQGTLSLVCAGPAGLLDALTVQDTLSFTGSAATALALRTHRSVAGRAVPFNAEADSLNCSILGPDVTAGDPEFALFVDQLVTEMTVKAGQKCTAIRRALVPAALADTVTQAVIERLARTVVGHPAHEGTDMGPLAGLPQREEVRAAVAQLSRETKIVFGAPDRVEVAGADAQRGGFLSPLLLRCDDPAASAPHEIEAFGPVTTLIPYQDLGGAAAASARGGGSLAGSIITADDGIARTLITALAPWHGRLLVLNRHKCGGVDRSRCGDAANAARRARPRWRRAGAGWPASTEPLPAAHRRSGITRFAAHPGLTARQASPLMMPGPVRLELRRPGHAARRRPGRRCTMLHRAHPGWAHPVGLIRRRPALPSAPGRRRATVGAGP